MKRIISLCLCASVFNLNALPIHWDVELAAQPPQVFTLQRPRGETYELEAVLKNRGKPFAPAITNACIYWQTNGMENLYWSAPASVSNNFLRATWLPSMDPGATTIRGYIGDPGHIYAAAFQFRFIASPGELPNELPLPQKVIDFAKVTVLNPPWSGGGGGGVDTNAVREIVHPMIASATNDLSQSLKDSISTSTNFIETQIAALQSGKRDKTDLAIYETRRGYVARNLPAGFTLIGQPEFEGDQWTWLFEERESHGGKYGDIFISTSTDPDSATLHFFREHVQFPELPDAEFDADLVSSTEPKTDQQLAAVATNSAAKPADGDLVKYDAANDRLVKAVAGTDYVKDAYTKIEMDMRLLAKEDAGTCLPITGGLVCGFIRFDNNGILIDDDPTRNNNWARYRAYFFDGEHAPFVQTLPAYLASGAWNTNTGTNRFARLGDIPTSSDTIRTYDRVRQCWWVLEMVNGVPTWTVED